MSALEKYTYRRFSRLKKLLRAYSSEEDVEILHGIRVEIKKVKAILQLLNEYLPGFHAHKHFTPLRNIFRKAGQIRQPQVFYELLLRFDVQGLNDSFIPGSRDQRILSRRFRREIPVHISTVRTRRKKLEKSLAKIGRAQIREYLKRRKKALRLKLQGNLSGDALHKARKVIKEIIYLEAMSKKSGKRELYLGQLDELIGQWHDRQLLLEVLKKARNLDLERLRSERDKAMEDILKSVSEFYIPK
jgi:CHAD domain-containing protein